MKKYLFIVLLFFLSNRVLSETISSSLYIPESKKIVSNIKLGSNKTTFNYSQNNKHRLKEYYFIEENGKFGLFENILVNFGIQYEIKRKYLEKNISSDFSKFYFGTTDRILNNEHSKIDLSINFGKKNMENMSNYDENFINLSLLYGLNYNNYNTSLKINYIYNSNFYDYYINYKINNSYVLGLFYYNQFIFTDYLSFDLNLYINHINKIKENKIMYYNSYNEYGVEVVLNYSINKDNILSFFYDFSKSNIFINIKDNIYKNKKKQNIGLKTISQF